jgi:hypothetical protein
MITIHDRHTSSVRRIITNSRDELFVRLAHLRLGLRVGLIFGCQRHPRDPTAYALVRWVMRLDHQCYCRDISHMIIHCRYLVARCGPFMRASSSMLLTNTSVVQWNI